MVCEVFRYNSTHTQCESAEIIPSGIKVRNLFSRIVFFVEFSLIKQILPFKKLSRPLQCGPDLACLGKAGNAEKLDG